MLKDMKRQNDVKRQDVDARVKPAHDA